MLENFPPSPPKNSYILWTKRVFAHILSSEYLGSYKSISYEVICMFVVHYFENKNLLLTQLVQNVPAVEDTIKIKGRKGKVINVTDIDGRNIHVQIELDRIVKKSAVVDPKKKRR